MLKSFKKLPRDIFLRGPILKKWIARKARQLDRACCEKMLRTSDKTISIAPAIHSPKLLRRILFIADCMWELNDLVPELRKIVPVEVLNLQPFLAKKPSTQSPAETVASTIRAFAAEQKNWEPDLIFFYARPSLLSEEAFHILRCRWPCFLLGMNLDDKVEFFPYGIFSSGNDNYQYWAKNFDLNLTSSICATEWYRERGLRCLYSPPGVHIPDDFNLPISANFKYEFSFLGSIKPERESLINKLLQFNVPIQLFGSGWPSGQWVTDPNAIFRDSQINLGIGLASPSTKLTTNKGRDFACPGVGACYLTTYNWELLNHYELGKEILCYRNVEELIEMYSWYRKRPEECLKIAQAAWRRCSAEHTWEKRFRKAFQTTGFKI